MSSSMDEIKMVLVAMGIDDATSMPDSEVISLARTMGLDIPEAAEEHTAGSEMDTAEEPQHADLDTAFIADDPAQTSTNSDPNNGGVEGDTAVAASQLAMEDSSHDDAISAFCSITGSDPTAARHLLEAFGWDLDGAVSMFLEGNAGGGMAAGGTQTTTPPSGPSIGTRGTAQAPPRVRYNPLGDSDEGFVFSSGRTPMTGIGGPDNEVTMPPRPGMPGTEFSHQQHLDNVLQNLIRSSMGMQMGDDDGMDGPIGGAMGAGMAEMMAAYAAGQRPPQPRQPDRYDEDGVRLPDPVQRERLVSGGMRFGGGGRREFGRAEDPSVEWMFPPPRHLSSQASLDDARAEAAADGRWLLVNIQSHEEFPSHMLNRDTWVHDTIESILRTTYLFWQRGHTSGDGRDYMNMYRLSEDDLPHIGIIDPRTGAKLLTLTGFMPPEDLAIRLVEFQERHPLPVPSARASNAASSEPHSQTPSQTGSGRNSFGNLSDAEASGFRPAGAAGAGAGGSGGGGNSSGVPHSAERARGIAALTREDSTHAKGDTSPEAVEDEGVSGQKLAMDYGPVPTEPAEGEEGAVKVSIKLSNGKAYARRYRKSDNVDGLFAVAAAMDEAGGRQAFDLVSRFPTLSLLLCRGKTIEECSLAGCQLIMKPM